MKLVKVVNGYSRENMMFYFANNILMNKEQHRASHLRGMHFLEAGFRTVADDYTQYPTVDEEKRQRSKPHSRKEGADTKKLELVALLQPSGLA